ncbi:unnamed protein product [Chironomus riparius]|uniref:Uncharacterized protein n=1 Tax=Chironomus riparius TaxID=315576 RepID=A0A9N9S633_9DIPT|nr:unnamed protein product [Chironomus riparius]
MSVDGKMCRVCLATQKTSRFNLIFGNNGKIAKQIHELSGVKILEFKQCPALICPKCTGNLQRALELHNSIIDNNRHFNEIYKVCRFKEYDIELAAGVLSDESDEWKVEVLDEDVEIKNEPNTSSELSVRNIVGNYNAPESEEFIVTEEIKQEPEDEVEQFTTETKIFDNQAQDLIEITTEIKEEPEEIQEFKFDDLPEEVLLAIDSDNSDELDDGEYLDESGQSTSQQSRKRGRKDINKSFTCLICGHIYCNELDRQKHLATAHSQKKRKLNDSQMICGKDWMCCYCGESFRTKADSVNHRKTEHREEEESLNCRHCQMQFTQRHHLRIHIKYTHLGKSFFCSNCNSKFNNQESFKAHMEIEKNQRNFVCKICAASFILKSGLTKHMKKHESDKHACEHCGLKFATQAMLKNHLKAVHSKSKPFRCGSCHETFEFKSHLQRHLSKGNCSTTSRT